MKELLAEVFASMRSNKMRIALTGFSIGWGMFILIVLVGAGNGLLVGMTANFSSMSQNVVTLSSGKTSIATLGLEKGRPVDLDMKDINLFLDRNNAEVYPYIKKVFPGYSKTLMISRGLQYITVPVDGVSPGWEVVKNMHLTGGRDINDYDIDNIRKTVILSEDLVKILFDADENPVGQYVSIGDISFLVVGTVRQNISTTSVRNAYVPVSTALSLYRPDGRLASIYIQTMNLTTKEKNEQFVAAVREMLAEKKHFSSSDKKAVEILNPFEIFLEIYKILTAIKAFIWVIGLATLIAGVVGISNIMLITVKERTREIGIRLAMGAGNFSIVSLILTESVIIAMIFGYSGMMFGVGLTQLAAWILDMSGNSMIFGAPTVSITVIIVSNLIMILAGIIAGYMPARKAITIKLVDALAS